MKIDRGLRQQWLSKDDVFVAEPPLGWTQGRTLYGGLTGAYAAALATQHVPDDRPLRTFNGQLMRPIAPGLLFGRCAVEREGKSSTFVTVELFQDEVAARFQLVFGRARDESLRVAPEKQFTLPQADELMELPFVEGLTPEFTKHLQLRWADGTPPFFGHDRAEFTGACRFRESAADIEGLIGLLDAWPCPSLSKLSEPAFASTATWSAHIVSVPEDFSGWFAFKYRTVAGQEGFHSTRGELFAPSGELVALSEQMVMVFD